VWREKERDVHDPFGVPKADEHEAEEGETQEREQGCGWEQIGPRRVLEGAELDGLLLGPAACCWRSGARLGTHRSIRSGGLCVLVCSSCFREYKQTDSSSEWVFVWFDVYHVKYQAARTRQGLLDTRLIFWESVDRYPPSCILARKCLMCFVSRVQVQLY
jgi:hypothetical protein